MEEVYLSATNQIQTKYADYQHDAAYLISCLYTLVLQFALKQNTYMYHRCHDNNFIVRSNMSQNLQKAFEQLKLARQKMLIRFKLETPVDIKERVRKSSET